MQLSLHADYGLRVLMYLGTHPGQVISTRQISDAYSISKHHLVRVVHTLAEHGYVHVTPGRSGGVTLAKDPRTIALGNVVRDVEPNLNLVECFDHHSNTCPITSVCMLHTKLNDALSAFLAELNKNTLGDLLAGPRSKELREVFVQLRRR